MIVHACSCYTCGKPCGLNDDGTTNHVDDDERVDHEADARHVALLDEELCPHCGKWTDDPDEHAANCGPDEE